MFRNLERGQFEKVSDSLGADFIRSIAGRDLATGDYDDDGNMDMVTNNRGDYPSLLRDDRGNTNKIIARKEGAGMVNKHFPKIPPMQPASAPSKALRK